MRSVALLVSLPILCHSLETKPWLGTSYECTFGSAFTYSRYSKVQNASVQLKSPSNDYDVLFDLGFTASPQFDVQAELELVQTPRQSFGVRSAAIQARYQILDDIAGDPISCALGINLRGVPNDSLRDVSSPYAGNYNVELTGAIGKEWSCGGHWTSRAYAFATGGIAEQGLPWTRALMVWQKNVQNTHHFTAFATGLFGFGTKQHVNVRHFHGWGKFHHQSIDLGASYGYHFGVYGTLSASYAYRVFARDFPENVNFFTLSYEIPFSLL
ncbi:MAG: hypothetical protein V4492_03025 [Chlamydiota bacterium]